MFGFPTTLKCSIICTFAIDGSIKMSITYHEALLGQKVKVYRVYVFVGNGFTHIQQGMVLDKLHPASQSTSIFRPKLQRGGKCYFVNCLWLAVAKGSIHMLYKRRCQRKSCTSSHLDRGKKAMQNRYGFSFI